MRCATPSCKFKNFYSPLDSEPPNLPPLQRACTSEPADKSKDAANFFVFLDILLFMDLKSGLLLI